MSGNGARHNTKTINYMERTYVFGDGGSGGSKLDVTATLPILIGVNGDTRPLLEYAGTPATVANFAGAGIYEIHYNRYTNQLYIVNGGFRPSAAATA